MMRIYKYVTLVPDNIRNGTNFAWDLNETWPTYECRERFNINHDVNKGTLTIPGTLLGCIAGRFPCLINRVDCFGPTDPAFDTDTRYLNYAVKIQLLPTIVFTATCKRIWTQLSGASTAQRILENGDVWRIAVAA